MMHMQQAYDYVRVLCLFHVSRIPKLHFFFAKWLHCRPTSAPWTIVTSSNMVDDLILQRQYQYCVVRAYLCLRTYFERTEYLPLGTLVFSSFFGFSYLICVLMMLNFPCLISLNY